MVLDYPNVDPNHPKILQSQQKSFQILDSSSTPVEGVDNEYPPWLRIHHSGLDFSPPFRRCRHGVLSPGASSRSTNHRSRFVLRVMVSFGQSLHEPPDKSKK